MSSPQDQKIGSLGLEPTCILSLIRLIVSLIERDFPGFTVLSALSEMSKFYQFTHLATSLLHVA